MVKSQSWTDNLRPPDEGAAGASKSHPASPWHRASATTNELPSTSLMKTSKSDHVSLSAKAGGAGAPSAAGGRLAKKDSLIDFGAEEMRNASRKEAESRLTRVRIYIFPSGSCMRLPQPRCGLLHEVPCSSQVSVLEAFDPLLMGDVAIASATSAAAAAASSDASTDVNHNEDRQDIVAHFPEIEILWKCLDVNSGSPSTIPRPP